MKSAFILSKPLKSVLFCLNRKELFYEFENTRDVIVLQIFIALDVFVLAWGSGLSRELDGSETLTWRCSRVFSFRQTVPFDILFNLTSQYHVVSSDKYSGDSI